MMFTIGMSVLGVIALVSMIMMIGNVFSKSPYGRIWALIGGASVFFCALLMVLRILLPQAQAADTSTKKKADVPKQSTTVAEAQQPTQTTDGSAKAAAQEPSLSGDEQDLSFLATVLQSLKDGKPIPPEFLALLPDGGLSIMEAEAKAYAPAAVSKPLQSQLVSLARSEGKSTYTTNTYVPTKTSFTPTSSGSSQSPAPTPTPTSPAGNSGSSTPPASTGDGSTTPTQPAPTPTPAPTPAPTPPPSGTLVDGGLLKSVLGHSKDDVQAYFMYNQSLGTSADGNTLMYLRGSATVSVSFEGDVATAVKLDFGKFTPSGKDSTYYANYIEGFAGMTDTPPTSGGDGNRLWTGVYPGASSISVQIYTSSNSGSLTAKL